MSIALIPESAPFNDEQRAWLNGFFAGLMGVDGGASEGGAAGAALGELEPAPAEGDEEEFPWHDPALDLDERLKLAEGKPQARRLMAAMAQLDCGACGYQCQTYAEAIACGDEDNLTLCVPGGRETSKALKRLVKESGSDASSSKAAGESPAADGAAAGPGRNRKHPLTARLVESRRLNGERSAKDTRHVVIDLGGSGLQYNAGDALGVWPTNCGELVDEILAAAGLDAQTYAPSPAGAAKPLREVLVEDCCLNEPTEELLALLVDHAADSETADRLRTIAADDQRLASLDVLDVLRIARPARLDANALVAALERLNPRLYSIASSQRAYPEQVHLTVGRVCYTRGERIRKGVASTMFADRLAAGDSVRVFVQASHGFAVPGDPQAPMIMVGPGTGIAPFLAFLQERQCTRAAGENWLFFGDQRRDCDFLYERQLNEYLRTGVLDRLDTAFSRDQEAKVYVQDRMREHAAELFAWLERGAHFFVCGDASRMAADVDRALHEIVASEGGRTAAEAKQYVAAMIAEKRYQRDVY